MENKLPARVVVFFVMALALFYGDSREGSCESWWAARQRLGAEVVRDLCERVSVP